MDSKACNQYPEMNFLVSLERIYGKFHINSTIHWWQQVLCKEKKIKETKGKPSLDGQIGSHQIQQKNCKQQHLQLNNVTMLYQEMFIIQS